MYGNTQPPVSFKQFPNMRLVMTSWGPRLEVKIDDNWVRQDHRMYRDLIWQELCGLLVGDGKPGV